MKSHYPDGCTTLPGEESHKSWYDDEPELPVIHYPRAEKIIKEAGYPSLEETNKETKDANQD